MTNWQNTYEMKVMEIMWLLLLLLFGGNYYIFITSSQPSKKIE